MTIREYLKIAKVGDIIEAGFRRPYGSPYGDGDFIKYTIIDIKDGYDGYIEVKDGLWTNKWNNLDWIINIINNKISMNIKEKFVLALTKEPQKSFRKVGITNGDDILTEDGEKVFMSWLLHSKFAEEFKKDVVEDMLKDKEKEEKKD